MHASADKQDGYPGILLRAVCDLLLKIQHAYPRLDTMNEEPDEVTRDLVAFLDGTAHPTPRLLLISDARFFQGDLGMKFKAHIRVFPLIKSLLIPRSAMRPDEVADAKRIDPLVPQLVQQLRLA
ncbi:hypothetical protein D3C81_1665880 [compost metagenome]